MSIYATLAFNLKNVFSAVNKTTVMVTLEYIWFRYLIFFMLMENECKASN